MWTAPVGGPRGLRAGAVGGVGRGAEAGHRAAGVAVALDAGLEGAGVAQRRDLIAGHGARVVLRSDRDSELGT